MKFPILVLFSILMLNAHLGLACNCAPVHDVKGLNARVDISDLFFEGTIVSIEKDSLPYPRLKVKYQINRLYKGHFDASVKYLVISYGMATSCGVQEKWFIIGNKKILTARTTQYKDESEEFILDANWCDAYNNPSTFDQEELSGFLGLFED